ncbi:TetR family transcriptional regulator [Curtobacterium pusillum]|uniref:acyl-CoA-like ligand-binding transcription factor n=1 Tax=Curtobacterium pusillum TaxID=69373 RepID=UPI0011A91B01|nr:TetR family transcriptional regulator [Curtobacterium pusillum]
MSETSVRTGLRDITREAVRARIAAVAVARFDRDGFDAVTVEQIAAEVGISARSFHRYFPAKEDTVIGDPRRHRGVLADALRERPADEPVWESLREAFAGMMVRADEDPEYGRRSVRVMTSTPSLRARNLEKHLAWADVLTPLVVDRLRGSDQPELRAAVLVQAALGCFDVAIDRWSVTDEDAPTLLRRTFDTLASAV